MILRIILSLLMHRWGEHGKLAHTGWERGSEWIINWGTNRETRLGPLRRRRIETVRVDSWPRRFTRGVWAGLREPDEVDSRTSRVVRFWP